MKGHSFYSVIRILVLLACLLSVLFQGLVSASAQEITVPPEWQIIKLTNDLRASLGLPPLAYNPLLTRAAREQSRAMGDDSFFSHDNPITGSSPSSRVAEQGYRYFSVGENIAAGYPTAEETMTGWINSPGHYANLIRAEYREIGVGYIYRDSDPQEYGHYWTQNFGSRADYFPVVIDGEAYLTTDTQVDVYIYGDSAVEMRLGIQGEPMGEWQPYQAQIQFTLPSAPASYTLVAETRDSAGNIQSASDEIILVASETVVATATPSGELAASGGLLPPETPSVATIAPSPTANLLITATPLPLPTNFGQASPAPTLNPDQPERLDLARRYPWWIVIPLAMMLLILALHAFHYWRSGEIWMLDSTLKWVCRIPRIAFIAYLLLAAGVIGHLSKGLWEESGKIIWQVDNKRSTFTLFDDYTDELRHLHNFEQDQFGCVGCHVFSPESQRMVFTADRITGDVYQWDGETVTPLDFQSSYMSFSPDGQRMVVARNDEDLYLYDFNDKTLTPLEGASEPSFIETMPAWSKDGNTIIFARSETPLTGLDDRLSMPLDLFYVPLNGGQIAPLTGASEVGVFEYYPTISPDGRWIAFTRHANQTTYADPLSEVWAISVTGGTARRLAANDTGEGVPTTGNSMAVWSQDSNWLAFGTLRQDGTFDTIVTTIHADGSSDIPYSLAGASEIGIFDDRPAWWVEPAQLTFADFLRQALFWLLPLIPLFLLVRLACGQPDEEVEEVWQPIPPREPIEPSFITRKVVRVLWEPRPTLVIGLGATGRHVLTQLKKNLLDAGLELIPDHIALLALTTGRQTEEQRSRFRFAGVELDDEELVLWNDSLVDMVRASGEDAALYEWVEKDYLLGLGDHALDPQTGLDGQRGLGRLALINNLRGKTRQTGISLWDRLNDLAKRAVDHTQRLRVIIVSETSDDVASGQFIDVAYLMRLFEQQAELEMHIVAHVVTDRALHRASEPAKQANTVAMLRELARFQLANNTPQIMKYSTNAGEKVAPFDGIFRDRLIDELYLYDGENQPRPLNTTEPKYGLYPALADFIAAWMDTALHEGGLVGWRDKHLRATHEQQRSRRELMLSSAGIYQYRLPFADLLRDITLKYAGQVLHMLLMGKNPDPPRPDAGLVTEVFIKNQNPQNLAIAFLGGVLGGSSDLSKEWASLLDSLARRNPEQTRAALKKLKSLSEADEIAWKAWLGNSMVILLNGMERGNPLEKRGAKLPLVLAVLQNLVVQGGILSQLMRNIEDLHHSNGEIAIAGLTRLAELGEGIYQQVILLAEGLGSKSSDKDSLYARIQREIGGMNTVWQEYRRIQTRSYILVDDENKPLSEKWYNQYMVSHVSDGLEQLYWRWSQDRLQLVLRLSENEAEVVFEPDAMEVFEQALLRLGQHFAVRVRDEESLAAVLGEKELNRDNIQQTAKQLLERCGVILSVETGIATGLDKSLLLSLNEGVEQAPTLEKHLLSAPEVRDLLRLNVTDPFSLSLIQMADTVPLSGVPTVQTALTQYNRDEAVLERSQGLIKPTAAFPAEANALYYERRLHLLEQARRVLHPVVVSGLVNDERVRVYLLAAAAQREWVMGSDLRFNAPEWNGVLLEARNLANPVHGVLMDGLLSFIQLISDPMAHRIYNRYLNDDTLQAIWDEWDVAKGQPWRDKFASRTVSTQILEDLIAITRIIIYEMLE